MPSTHPFGQPLHLFDGIKRSYVVSTGKFRDVAVKVSRAHAVKRAVESFLEHRPKRLQAVRVGHFIDPFTEAVIHGPVVVESSIRTILVRELLGSLGHVLGDERV